ncbi:Small-conductance mechanosensitive channel [Yoonia tamlensis]|uniref:Small-conductance mechanosensitive channel n=1 Tax=Yoonia tamlensis TaxID=390270 RepID=A0A1I6G8U9_9RHOB|nr:DUF3772 domain-containing protein [Yoonia tamlensis]SFR38636.1 Small-conductance mechanosensitive channel [Yoonia tamlensis]
MIQRFALLLCLVWLWPIGAAAQDEEHAQDLAWELVATRAENLVQSGDASRFVVQQLRAELVIWRDRFLENTSVNAGRLATVNAQIAALGPVPETGEEAQSIVDRRAALDRQRRTLDAPRRLAEESFARANGLIGEFDAIVLQQQTQALTERSATPLNPTYIGPALLALWNVGTTIVVETRGGFSAQIAQDALWPKIPRAAVYLVIAVALIGAGRRRITQWRAALLQSKGRLMPLWIFLLAIVQILVPVVGLFLLTRGLQTLGVFGVMGEAVVDAIPTAGFAVVFAWWLSRQIFPLGPLCGFLGYAEDMRAAGRRYALAIAWVLAFWLLLDAAMAVIDVAQHVVDALVLPIVAVLGVLLWGLGHTVMQKPVETEGARGSSARLRGALGKICIAIAIVAPLALALGYGAGQNLMLSWLYSLCTIGMLLFLQRLVLDLSAPDNPETAQQTGLVALAPIAINLALFVAAIPVLALIWGARVDDLAEVWARFREGFAIGESRISPTDFLTFAMVFGLGYLLTRTVQGTLRKTVLPRTRLDLGGQNAVVAGFGYVGIILAAIIAITSAGIDLSNLAIVAGALSVGIGFGLQNIVSNFVSGIILLIERPVSEGDWIEVGGQMGYVRAISVRSTRIETFDRTDVIVPNADLVSGQVTNWTRGNLVGRVIVPVGVAYGTDVKKVAQILREIAEAHPLVLMTPPPTVLFVGFGADSLDFEIRAILRDVNFVMLTKSEMNFEISRRFAEEGIEIPFAQRDIWLRNPEALLGDKT